MQAKVLIVDDDAALAENVAEIVGTLSVATEIVSTARDAMARAGQGDLAVALVDLRLPDGSGGALVKFLRERSPFTQVILITGDANLETAVAAVSDGAFAYVLKPFAPEKLLDTAKRALDHVTALRERQRLSVELERSERRHREVVEAVPAFVAALDADGKILLWNRRLEEATGFTRAEMLGRSGRDLITEDGSHSLPTKDGRGILVRWERAVVGDESPMTYAVGADVTHEQAMLRRTLRAERLAAVGTLAAGLAHEIRNPLNAASLQLALLARRIDKGNTSPESIKQVVAIVQSEIQRLERLVNDFLAFARPTELRMESVMVNGLCADVIAFIEVEAETARVRIERRFTPDLPAVEADAERLRQVLLNLVRNAIEAMPDGGTLTVRTGRTPGGVEIQVEDTGLGVPDESAIFDAFFTTKPHGTGLGLSLAHRIVADHGGQISVRSRPGETCFTVNLPARIG